MLTRTHSSWTPLGNREKKQKKEKKTESPIESKSGNWSKGRGIARGERVVNALHEKKAANEIECDALRVLTWFTSSALAVSSPPPWTRGCFAFARLYKLAPNDNGYRCEKAAPRSFRKNAIGSETARSSAKRGHDKITANHPLIAVTSAPYPSRIVCNFAPLVAARPFHQLQRTRFFFPSSDHGFQKWLAREYSRVPPQEEFEQFRLKVVQKNSLFGRVTLTLPPSPSSPFDAILYSRWRRSTS